jgi:hypothetical protein
MNKLSKLALASFALSFFVISHASAGGLTSSQSQAVAKNEIDPSRVLSLTSDSMELRQLQSRKFDDSSEANVLKACVHVLQDLGFVIDNTDLKLGLVKGTKAREAVEAGQVAGKIIFAIIFGGNLPIDKNQNLVSSIVVSSAAKANTTIVRVTFGRVVWNDVNAVSKAERLEDPQIYQEFYEKLSKSLFLEAQNI